MKTVIFDIDGTLALIDHRRKYLEQDKPDWASFNHWMNIEQDQPNLPVIELLCGLERDYTIVIVTGRMEYMRDITIAWLKKHIQPGTNPEYIVWDELYMRKNDDNRADHIVKKEILDQLLAEGHNILFAVDDRKQVVDMWRANGITCLQVAEGNF